MYNTVLKNETAAMFFLKKPSLVIVVVYQNGSDKFHIGHCPIKVKVITHFATCSTRFSLQSEGVHILALEHYNLVKKIKFSLYVHHTLIYTNYEHYYA